MINIDDEESEFNKSDIMKACHLLKEEGNRHFEKGKYDLAFASYHSCLASVDQMKQRPGQYPPNEVADFECICLGNIANTLCIMSGSDKKINEDKVEYYKTNKYPKEMNYFFEMFNKYSTTNSFMQLLGANLFIARALKRKPDNIKYLIWRIQILKKLNLETMFKYVTELFKHKECDRDIMMNMRTIIIEKIGIIKDWHTIQHILEEGKSLNDWDIMEKSAEHILSFYDLSKIKNKKMLEERKESKNKFIDQSGPKLLAVYLLDTKKDKLVVLGEKILDLNNENKSLHNEDHQSKKEKVINCNIEKSPKKDEKLEIIDTKLEKKASLKEQLSDIKDGLKNVDLNLKD